MTPRNPHGRNLNEVTDAPTAPSSPVSFEEFLHWLDEGTRAEWVDGEILVMSPSNWQHQDLIAWLTGILRYFIDGRGLGRVVAAPFQIKLPGPRGSSREPDILYIATDNPGTLHRTLFEGAPDLAIEIVSPESVNRDHVEKFNEYEHAGVREYWVIDPQERRADFFTLSGAGHFVPIPVQGGAVESALLPGLHLNVQWLFAEPLPRLPEVLKEMGLI